MRRSPRSSETASIRFSVSVYVIAALLTAASAHHIVVLFADSPSSVAITIEINLVYAACIAVVFREISGTAAGPLDVSGDTMNPFVSQLIGMFCGSIPLAYLGANGLAIPPLSVPVLGVTVPGTSIPTLGYWGLYLTFIAETDASTPRSTTGGSVPTSGR